MADLVISEITHNSFSAYVTNLDISYSRNDRTIYWYLNGSLYTISELGAHVPVSPYITFSYLSSNTSYSVEAQIYYTNSVDDPNYQTVSVYGNCVTSAPPRPAKFSWTYPKTKGADFNLKATEWNALTANINLVRAYYGLSLYTFTTAYVGNNFLASMYNECLYAMNPMYLNIDLTGIAVSSGDDITADLLNYLVTLVNGL